jgi:hypothetical protein
MEICNHASDVNSFHHFRVGKIAKFPSDFIMYEAIGLIFNQEHQLHFGPIYQNYSIPEV